MKNTVIVDIEVSDTKTVGQRKCKLTLSNGDKVMFPVPCISEERFDKL